MGLYGVEKAFWVGDAYLEVSFSNDNVVGLCQRDVTVGHRRKGEDLALTGFTGPQLFEASCGPDHDARKEAFAQRLEALRASYKEARRTPHANSTHLLRHKTKDLKRLEKALAQELCPLDRSQINLNRVQGQVQHTKGDHVLRSFSFDEVDDRSIHHFCRKYATDVAYRADVENGAALWVCQHTREILADQEYQRLKQSGQASAAACRHGLVDPGMWEVVAVWDALPGVVVSISCQGASGVISYGGKTLVVPSARDKWVIIVVGLDDEAVIEVIEGRMVAFPLICLMQYARPVGSYSAAPRKHCRMRSQNVTSKAQVRQELMGVAGEVRAQWFR